MDFCGAMARRVAFMPVAIHRIHRWRRFPPSTAAREIELQYLHHVVVCRRRDAQREGGRGRGMRPLCRCDLKHRGGGGGGGGGVINSAYRVPKLIMTTLLIV